MSELDAATLVKILALAGAMFALLNGLFFWSFKWALDRHYDRVEERLGTLSEADEERGRELKALEQQLHDLRVELAEKYVQRADWIRFSSSIDQKLDTVRASFDALKEKLTS